MQGPALAVCAFVFWCLLSATAPNAQGAPIPVEAFAADNALSDAAISPDGRYLAAVTLRQGHHVAMVYTLQSPQPAPKLVLADVPGEFNITWCNWATNTRLLCAYRGIGFESYVPMRYSVTRLVAVDADGAHRLVLLQDSDQASGQFQDRIVDWHPGKPDTVLIQADENLLVGSVLRGAASQGVSLGNSTTHGYPAVFELNVVTGSLHMLLHAYEPILTYLSDFHGAPRVAAGIEVGSKTIQYFVRSGDGKEWRHLLKYEAFMQGELRTPIAIDATDPSRAYAIGYSGGRDALWLIDLNDVRPPQLVYANESVDVSGAQLLKDGELVGVSYETDWSHTFYTNPRLRQIMNQLDMAMSETSNRVIDCTTDLSLCVVRAGSDVQPGLWFLLDTTTRRLTSLGRSNPSLDPDALAHMQPISYPARDGTSIPGYLTKPLDAPPGPLPLVVMPHGGPIARDYRQFFFLQQFLVNRGYAVLQINFRGSGGLGHDWYEAAHQDWGGLTYDDIVDGTRWAVTSGIADPHRVAIVGWSFGGYAALLGAMRDGDLFHCAVSIAGISDLGLLLEQKHSPILREQIGTRSAKLNADSPRRHAQDVTIPVMMFHGDTDPQVDVDHSRAMASALKAAGKPYRYVEFKGADHQIVPPEDRIQMLRLIEEFLSDNIGPSGTRAESTNPGTAR